MAWKTPPPSHHPFISFRFIFSRHSKLVDRPRARNAVVHVRVVDRHVLAGDDLDGLLRRHPADHAGRVVDLRVGPARQLRGVAVVMVRGASAGSTAPRRSPAGGTRGRPPRCSPAAAPRPAGSRRRRRVLDDAGVAAVLVVERLAGAEAEVPQQRDLVGALVALHGGRGQLAAQLVVDVPGVLGSDRARLEQVDREDVPAEGGDRLVVDGGRAVAQTRRERLHLGQILGGPVAVRGLQPHVQLRRGRHVGDAPGDGGLPAGAAARTFPGPAAAGAAPGNFPPPTRRGSTRDAPGPAARSAYAVYALLAASWKLSSRS